MFLSELPSMCQFSSHGNSIVHCERLVACNHLLRLQRKHLTGCMSLRTKVMPEHYKDKIIPHFSFIEKSDFWILNGTQTNIDMMN